MTQEQYFKNLLSPKGVVDVVLDTDAYNEIDDQFAVAYLLRSGDRLNTKGICAAPFSMNHRSSSPADGMEKSYNEIFKLLKLMDREDFSDRVYRGSDRYLPDENTYVDSDAARYMAELVNEYSPARPLYIVAIGAITNVASAILMNPKLKENAVIVWLGGHAQHRPDTNEYNMMQDVAAARVVFGSGTPLVQLPCNGVVDRFATTRYELEHWMIGKNALCDYLATNVIEYMGDDPKGISGWPWSKVIWDATAIGWLLNEDNRFMTDELIHSPIPEYDHHYGNDNRRHYIRYVNRINRDALFADLFQTLTK